jgi:hypothetical protein
MKMNKPERITLNQEEITSLQSQLSACNLEEGAKKIITGILEFYLWLQWALQETKLNLHRLRSLFGLRKTEKRSHLHKPPLRGAEDPLEGEESEGEEKNQESAVDNAATPDEMLKFFSSKKKSPPISHGRLKHEDYTGALTVEQPHETLKARDACPTGCGGRLYSLKPHAMVCLKGNALASATRYLFERFRCALCGEVFTAKPAEGTPRQKYDEALKAQIAIAKNYAGLPFYRIERLQKMVGVPLPDATQWQLTQELIDDINPVYHELERLAAQGEMVCYDDTGVKILSCIKENKEDPTRARKGTYTTGIVARIYTHMIYLFISSRLHAGENIAKLLGKRFSGLEPIIGMSDALGSNLSTEFMRILCLCLAHGRRKFYEIYDYFPGECRVVIDALSLVYHYDEITKNEQMNAQKRLIYHQVHSAPIMATLKMWMELQLKEKKAEPNGSLGKAFQYMLNHWEGLTRFLTVPGALLDNNITERALKIPIRARKNSLFYKTENGALVGGMLTSIIHTCFMAGENPVDYLISLQKNRRALWMAPQDWLPWTYKSTLSGRAPPLLLAYAA